MGFKLRKIRPDLEKWLFKRGLNKKWDKAKFFLENDLGYPSLNFEKSF